MAADFGGRFSLMPAVAGVSSSARPVSPTPTAAGYLTGTGQIQRGGAISGSGTAGGAGAPLTRADISSGGVPVAPGSALRSSQSIDPQVQWLQDELTRIKAEMAQRLDGITSQLRPSAPVIPSITLHYDEPIGGAGMGAGSSSQASAAATAAAAAGYPARSVTAVVGGGLPVSTTVPITVSPKSAKGSVDESTLLPVQVVTSAAAPSFAALAKLGEELAYVRAGMQQQSIETLHRFREMQMTMEQLARRVQAGEAMIALTDELHRLKQADVHAVSSLDDARYQELLQRLQRNEERAITLAATEAERHEATERLAARVASLEQALAARSHDLEQAVERVAHRQQEIESRLGMLDSTWQQRSDALRRESEMRITALDESRQALQRQLETVQGRASSLATAQAEQLLAAVQQVQARCEALVAEAAREAEQRVEQLRSDCRTTVDALSADVVVVKHSISGLTRLLNKTVTSLRHRSPSPQRPGAPPGYAAAREFESDSDAAVGPPVTPGGSGNPEIAAFLSSLSAATR